MLRDAGARGVEVLLVQRKNPPSAGVWTLPGGRVEEGEALEAAIVRELAEETGLTARVVELLAIVEIAREGFHYRIHDFLCEPCGPTPVQARAGDDALACAWVPADEATLRGRGVNAEAVGIVLDAVRRCRRPGSPS